MSGLRGHAGYTKSEKGIFGTRVGGGGYFDLYGPFGSDSSVPWQGMVVQEMFPPCYRGLLGATDR